MVVGLSVDYTESFLTTDIGMGILRPYPIERAPMRQASKFRVNNLRGFTLLEVLIATAVTLLLMMGLAQIFKVLGDSITKGRAGLELNNRLRNVIHRVRTDLDNITASPRPPIKVGAGQGYLQYYDGPMHDAIFAANPLLNRFGDMDDIFMATVRADDAWFTGKVPRFVLEGRLPTSVSELSDLVTISSQFAEIAIFAEPIVTETPYNTSSLPNTNRDPIRLALDPTAGFEDLFAGTSGIPDGYRLHYRVLLIRPDLNLANGLLPGIDSVDPNQRVLVAGPEFLGPEFQIQPPQTPTSPTIVPRRTAVTDVNLPSPICDMWRVHQFCDLSVRRVYNVSDGLLGTHDYIAANSIEDLANPGNRFAHVRMNGSYSSTSFTTLPILALTPPLSFQTAGLSTLGTLQGLNAGPGFTNYFSGGFLHPVFSLLGSRAGEDVIATDVLAFDLKVFDSSAPVIDYSTPNADVVLRPGDPGFGPYGLASLTAVNTPDAFGEFVDLCWGSQEKLTTLPTPIDYANQARFVQSVFSGVAVDGAGTRTRTGAFLKSGLWLSEAANIYIYQPSFDTFTDFFEQDGFHQGQLAGTVGTVQFASTLTDAGRDGIDNAPTNGLVDDDFEKETSPPFATDLRGLQISIRLEDRATKQFKQMSTVKEFVTH